MEQRNQDREGKALGKEPKSTRGTAGWVRSDPSSAVVAVGAHGHGRTKGGRFCGTGV